MPMPAILTAVLLAASALSTAQVDPYTKSDPEALRAAGYKSLGPFPFGTNHTSSDIQVLLPNEPLLWIETAHFRIGSALSPRTLPSDGDRNRDKEALASVREELQRLARRLPAVQPDTMRLDEWLRAHLIAQRVEDVYQEVLGNLRCSDADFPPAPGDDPKQAATFRGLGPFLGLPQKYTILLLQKSASLSRYTAAYQSWGTPSPQRYHDHRFGSVFFGACEESDGGLLRHDLALRTHLTFHVAHNLYQSYRSYGHNLPAWLLTGLAHRHARRISNRYPIYDLRDAQGAELLAYATWGKRAQALPRSKGFEPLATFLERMDVGTFSSHDHLQCWALVDWLMTQHPKATMQFLHTMKDPFHDRLRFPTDEELLTRQRAALVQAFGGGTAELEDRWRRTPLAVAKR